jgi:enoyl-CoA hydratase
MRTKFVSAQTTEHVAVVVMDRPPVNAVNAQFMEELLFVFDSLASDDDVRAIVLTGSNNIFCAGADLKDPTSGRGAVTDRRRLRAASDAFFAILACGKPTIAAVNGPALGAGAVLVASCDVLLASENALLGLPEVDVGTLGGARHVMRFLGHSLSRRMALTGYRVPAAELYRIGAIEKCVPRDQLLAEARAIAAEIAGKDPAVAQLTKRALNEVEEMSLRDGYAYEHELTLDRLAHLRTEVPTKR